jgi:hypothetical protein
MARANSPTAMEMCMMDSGRMIRGMVRASTPTVMEMCMMDSGRTGNGAERESLHIVMEMFTKQCGQESIHQNQELFKGTGDFGQAQRKIFKMENKNNSHTFKRKNYFIFFK